MSRGIFPSGLFYLAVVLSPTWWIPPLRLRCGRNDKWGYVCTDSPTVSRVFHAAPLPHQSGLRPASFPGGGSFCTGLWGVGVIGNGSVLSRAERHIGRSLRFRWWVGVFNRGIPRTGVYEGDVSTDSPAVSRAFWAAAPLTGRAVSLPVFCGKSDCFTIAVGYAWSSWLPPGRWRCGLPCLFPRPGWSSPGRS